MTEKKKATSRMLGSAFGWLAIVVGFLFALSLNLTNIEAGGDFIDFSKWTKLDFWIRIVANTVFVLSVYINFIHRHKNKLMDTEYINNQYAILMNKKEAIIDTNKKEHYTNYLNIIVNTDEKLEIYYNKLNSEMIRQQSWFNRTFRSEKALKRIEYLSSEKDRVDRYRSALRQLDLDRIKDNDFNINDISVNHKDVTFDVVFDLIEAESDRSVSVGYSDTKETNKYIRRQPLRSLFSVFTSIVAISNIFIFTTDILGAVISILVLGFMALTRINAAIRHATKIVRTKTRSLEKANLTTQVFLNMSDSQLQDLKMIIYKEYEKVEEPKEIIDMRKEAEVIYIDNIYNNIKDNESIIDDPKPAKLELVEEH